MSKWTDERVELLKTLCGQGFSGGAIKDRLNAEFSGGSAFTRNMVIGKARRLGLAFLPRKDRPEKPKSPPAPVKVKPSAAPIPASVVLPQEGAAFVTPPRPIEPTPVNPESVSGPVHILDLRKCHCRAVLETRGDDMLAMFCGEPKAEGSSYCAFHYGLFTQPPKESPHGKASNG